MRSVKIESKDKSDGMNTNEARYFKSQPNEEDSIRRQIIY